MVGNFGIPRRHYFPFAFSPRAGRKSALCSEIICDRNLPISRNMLLRSVPRGRLRAIASSFVAISSSSCSFAALISASPSGLVLFCANQSERLRVKFDGLHAALENAAYHCPGFTCGDQIEKPFSSSSVQRTLGITQSFSSLQPHLDQAQSTLAFCSISGPTLAPLISPPTRSAIIAIAPSAQPAMRMKNPLFDGGFAVCFP
jgi:hypothetical protein